MRDAHSSALLLRALAGDVALLATVVALAHAAIAAAAALHAERTATAATARGAVTRDVADTAARLRQISILTYILCCNEPLNGCPRDG